MADPTQPTPYEPPDENRPASASPTEGELEREAVHSSSKHDAYAALRFPAYRLFSIGWMAAVLGSQMTAVALGWEIFDRTHSPLQLTWLAGVQVIPLVFLALPAGVIADRFDRRRLIQITAALNALCSVGLALFSYSGSVAWMFAFVTLSATVLTIGRPARSALLPNIVPAAVFSNAVTWNSTIFQVSAMVGPALGGFFIARSQRVFHNLALPYLLDAASAMFYAVIMFWVPRPAQGPIGQSAAANSRAGEPGLPDHAPARESPLQQLAAGIHFVYRTRIIFATLCLDLFAVLLGGAVYILPIFAQDILHVDSVRFSWLRAGEAIGAVIMAFVIAHRPPMRRAGRAMLLSVAMFGVATIVFGLSRNFWVSLGALVVLGAFDNVSVVVRHTLVQVLTPDAMRGRVSAVNNVFIGASNELGGVESSLLAEWVGPVRSVVIGGIGTLLTVLVTAVAVPQLRKYGPLQPKTAQSTLKGRAGSAPVKT